MRLLLSAAITLLVVIGTDFVMPEGAAAGHTCVPTDPDLDGDGLPNSCDPYYLDDETDGDRWFVDSTEVFVGTNPLNVCSFPADVTNDGYVNVLDIVPFTPPVFNSAADDPLYRPRLDLTADEKINILDVNILTPPLFNQSCPWGFLREEPLLYKAVLRSGTTHFELAPLWFSNIAGIYAENAFLSQSGATCAEVKKATDHWTILTDFTFSAGTTGNCNTSANVRVFFRWTGQDPSVAAQTIPYSSSGVACTEGSPCHFAYYADILANPNFDEPRISGNPDFRHILFTHELGHVVGQGHTGFFPACQSAVPYTIMYLPGYCWGFWDPLFHWVRVNDAVFTNVKY